MPYQGVAFKITDHFYKNESSKSLKSQLHPSEYCKLLPENAFLCSFNVSHMTKEYTNWTEPHCTNIVGHEIRNVFVTLLVMLIVCISLFGNSILCKIVFFTKARSATNIFIGNISISDILMTVINVPIQFISIVLDNWPLGLVMCKSISFVQNLSVTTSSFTMACIALHRYYLIAHPLKAKPTFKTAMKKLVCIWILAATISLPYIFMAQIHITDSCQKLIRCKISYLGPKDQNRKLFTLLAFVLQYIIPLALSAIAYIRICIIITRRNIVGSSTHDQIIHHKAAKLKTIKLLVAVLITFALCWLPINIYHIYRDFLDPFIEKHLSSIYLICHMIAMSSVCYNPFIYFWMNKKFKRRVKTYLKNILVTVKIQNCRPFFLASKRLHNYQAVQKQSDTVFQNEACNDHFKANTCCKLVTEVQQKSETTKSKRKQNHAPQELVLKIKQNFFTSLPNIHQTCDQQNSRKKRRNIFASAITSTNSCETSV